MSSQAITRESGEGFRRPMKPAGLHKSPGGPRLLTVPVVRDRIVERAVLEIAEPRLDPVLSPWSFAYRSALGVDDAIRALARVREAGARWAVRADTVDCFESVPRWSAITRVRERVPGAELCLPVRYLVSGDVTGSAAGRVRAGRKQGRGLREGSSLSSDPIRARTRTRPLRNPTWTLMAVRRSARVPGHARRGPGG